LTLVACARLLGVDDIGARKSAGATISAGSGGMPAQGGTAGQSARAGRAARGAGTGGSDSGGGDGTLAGSAGETTAGAGGASNGAVIEVNGEAGAAGALPDGMARAGTDCAQKNQSACSDESPFVILQCSSGTWRASQTCSLDARCNPTNPASCTELDSLCYEVAPNGPICAGNTSVNCGPDVYVAEEHVCPFGCSNGACVSGAGGELTLHTGIVAPQKPWTAPIPVCLSTTKANEAADTEMFGWVQAEVESVYNRFFQVEFVDWERCEDAVKPRVMVSFTNRCLEHLVNDIEPVVPTSDAIVQVTLCRSYVDAAGTEHHVDGEQNQSLVRLLARHQFGHVLGLPDGATGDPTGMQRSVNAGHEDEMALTADDYVKLGAAAGAGYIPKPMHSIVTSSGSCLNASELANKGVGTVSAAPCAPLGMGAREEWETTGTQIQNTDLTSCFRAGALGEPVTVIKCVIQSAPLTFQLAHAEWRTITQCVGPADDPPIAGTKLITKPCTFAGDAAEAWSFEIRGTDALVSVSEPFNHLLVRIHFVAADLCVSLPNATAASNDELELLPCEAMTVDNDPQVFDFVDGALINQGYYVNWQDPAGVLFIAGQSAYSNFFTSGAFETTDGAALSLAPDSTLITTAFNGLPTPDQVFDVYF
jgi:hypothetical protein